MSAEALEAEKKLRDCENEIVELNTKMAGIKEAAGDLFTKAGKSSIDNPKFSRKAQAVNPDNKVSDISWYPKDNDHLCTVLQDGKIIIYNAKAKSPARFYKALNSWLMTAEFNKNGMLAVAGLDNVCSVLAIPDLSSEDFEPLDTQAPKKILEKHGGYLGTCKWMSNTKILTGSGDKSVMLWDIDNDKTSIKEPLNMFTGHGSDANSLAAWDGEENMFLSGSSDSTAKLWDIRNNKEGGHNGCVGTFYGHEKAVNDLKKVPGAPAFVTASEDGFIKMWDMRTQRCIQTYSSETAASKTENECTAVAVSSSGRMLIVGYRKGLVKIFDTLTGAEVQKIEHHMDGEMSSIEVSNDGKCFATGCRAGKEGAKNFALWA